MRGHDMTTTTATETYELSVCFDCLLALQHEHEVGIHVETPNYAPTDPADHADTALSELDGLTPIRIAGDYGFTVSSRCDTCGSYLGGDRWELIAIGKS